MIQDDADVDADADAYSPLLARHCGLMLHLTVVCLLFLLPKITSYNHHLGIPTTYRYFATTTSILSKTFVRRPWPAAYYRLNFRSSVARRVIFRLSYGVYLRRVQTVVRSAFARWKLVVTHDNLPPVPQSLMDDVEEVGVMMTTES